MGLIRETGELLEGSVREARRLAVIARRKARGRGARGKLKAAGNMEEMRSGARRSPGRSASGSQASRLRIGSCRCSTPTPRPIRKGKLRKPNEFGFVSQLAEVTENTKTGARGLILPASTEPGNPAEETLLPGTIAERTGSGSHRERPPWMAR